MSRLTVLGLGSPLMSDDGVGLVVLERLRQPGMVADDVDLVDGGTWGMNLLPVIEGATHLLLVDAIGAGAAPGTVARLEREMLPRVLGHKLSPHQIDLREVLALATLRGTLPERAVAIGVEPDRIALGTTLSPVVEAAVPQIVTAVQAQLAEWRAAAAAGRN
jgi:hydrogenase maturation protease